MIEVELPDGVIAEFPDDMGQDDIKTVLRKKFPAPEQPPAAPLDFTAFQRDEASPFSGIPTSSEELAAANFQRDMEIRKTFPGYEGMRGVPFDPQQGIFSGLTGLTPESVPSGKGPITIPLASVGRTAFGVVDYLSSPQGIAELATSLTPARLLVLSKWAADMAKGAGEEAGTLSTLIAKPDKTLEDWQQISDRSVNTLAMMFGSGATAKGASKPLRRAVEPPKMKAIRELEKSLLETDPAIPITRPTPQRQLGIPQAPLTAEPFLQPGVREMAGAALREAQGPRLEIPGELSALETLRREVAPPRMEQVEPTRLAERIPGGGEAPYGKVSYRRQAEAPTVRQMRPLPPGFGEEITAPSVETVRAQRELEARQKGGEKDALQQETETAFRPVRESEIAETRPQQVPAPSGSKEAAEALKPPPGDRFVELVSEDGTAEIVAFGDKYYDMGAMGKFPSIARWTGKGWSHGAATKGQTIREISKPSEPSAEPTVERVTPLDPQSGSPLSATDALINKMEALKFPEPPSETFFRTGLHSGFNLPHPEILRAVGRDAWNRAVDVAIASLKAGKAVAEAIDDAMSFLRTKAKGFDEAKARANIEFVARAETGEKRPVPSTESESVKMRKSAERATTSPMIPEPVQERIATAPESFYKQQSMKRVEETVADLSEGELAAIPRDSNLYTAARLEQAKRLFERGDNESGYRVFEELEKEGTVMGQLINQFKLLKGSRPENVVRVINETLKKEGKDVLNEKQAKEALEIATESKAKDIELDKATDAWTKNPSVENAKLADKALTDANASALKLQRFISRYSPRSTSAVIKSVLQGNLLTPISEVANIVGNMSFLPFRIGDRVIASALDVVDSFLTGKKRDITVQPISGTVEAVKGLGRGAREIPGIIYRGTGDVIKGETRAGLHPLQAWINQFAKNPEMPTKGGRLTLQDRLNLAIEGTLGIPAEVMLRGLGVGDVVFKEAARGRITAEQLKLANVPKEQWSFAQKFPELFLDRVAMDRIQADTLASVFQRPSRTLGLMTNWLRGRGAVIDLIGATIAPYKLTPWNLVGEILSYNPLVATARAVHSAKIGDRRAAKLNAGKLIVGSALATAGWWLYAKGLMSPSLDERDEAQKARVLSGEVMPPNHINISGLKRALAGGDPAFRASDETVDVFRGGGLAGSMFYMTANIGRDFERRPEVPGSEIWLSILRQSTLEQARFGMNQSFLSGVEGLLTAVKEGNADNYIRQWANTVASIPLPNTLTVASRASREFKPDFREDTMRKQVENLVRNKLGFAGLDDYLPLKRGLWGEPLPETPEGRNALIYHFFDITKNRQVTGDPVSLELFRLWRKTTDARVIPPLPDKVITFRKETYALNAEQQSKYSELVGQARRQIVDALVVNPRFHKLNDDDKITMLDRAYRRGLDRGKSLFLRERLLELSPKPQRAGFAPE